MFGLDQIEGDETVGAHAEIRGPAGQQLRHIHVRAALDDLHVQAALGIKPLRQRLVEAAMFALRFPVGDKADGSGGARRRCKGGGRGGKKKARRRIMPALYMI